MVCVLFGMNTGSAFSKLCVSSTTKKSNYYCLLQLKIEKPTAGNFKNCAEITGLRQSDCRIF